MQQNRRYFGVCKMICKIADLQMNAVIYEEFDNSDQMFYFSAETVGN